MHRLRLEFCHLVESEQSLRTMFFGNDAPACCIPTYVLNLLRASLMRFSVPSKLHLQVPQVLVGLPGRVWFLDGKQFAESRRQLALCLRNSCNFSGVRFCWVYGHLCSLRAGANHFGQSSFLVLGIAPSRSPPDWDKVGSALDRRSAHSPKPLWLVLPFLQPFRCK